MADNISITAGAGTTIAADEITINATSVKAQIIKIAFGTDGNYDGMVAPTTPMPVGGTTAQCIGKAEDAAHTDGDVGVFCLAIRRDTAVALAGTSGDYSGVAVNQYGSPLVNIDSDFQVSTAKGILKSEDAAHASGDAGVMMLAVRQDTAAAIAGTTGDYSPIAVNSFGGPKVDVDYNWQAAAATGLLKLEDAVHTTGDAGVMALGIRNVAGATLAGTNGDYSPFAVNSKGAIFVDFSPTLSESAAAFPYKAEDAAHTTGDTGVFILGVRNDTYATLAGTDLDYTPIAVRPNGAVSVVVDSGAEGSFATGLLKLEDGASASGDALVAIASVRQNTPATDTSTDGDYQFLKSNALGGIYVDPASRNPGAAEGSLAFGAVSPAYATLVTNSSMCRFASILNLLDTPVVISFDATNAFKYVAAGAQTDFPLTSNGMFITSNLSVKSIGSPTSGTVYGALVG